MRRQMTLSPGWWAAGERRPQDPQEAELSRTLATVITFGDGFLREAVFEMVDASLEALVKRLPEIYQPIYGAPEIGASRGNEARVELLIGQITKLSESYGRTLRILDLGSAQGYLTFRMAELGHEVTGVESLDVNVEVARAIQALHPSLAVSFVEGDLPGALEGIELGGYDVVVAFSVLHHVAHRDGQEHAAQLVAELSASIPHGLFEMALPSEPLFWAEALPDDPRVTLAAYPFIREIGQAGTHLSDVVRPMLFCSRSLALINGGLVPILSHTNRPHADANPLLAGLHRYFILPTGIAKIVARFEARAQQTLIDGLKAELRQEAEVLGILGRAGVIVPELLEFDDRSTESILVRTTFPGVVLSDAAELLSDDDRAEVTTQVLASLADLEARGLYHQDLRLWNILWDRAGRRAYLIDYGAIGASPGDAVWPFDARFSLLTLVNALWGGLPDQTGFDSPRSSLLDAADLPGPAASLASALVVHPRDGAVFHDIGAAWEEIRTSATNVVGSERPLAWGWLAQLERQRDEVRSELEAHIVELDRVRERLDKQERQLVLDQHEFADREAAHQHQIEALEAQHRQEMADRDAQHQQQLADRDDQLRQQRADRDSLASEMDYVHRSVSWRVTVPLRRLRARQRQFRHRNS